MILTKIQGEYIRQFPSLHIEFPKEGLMNINGPNGAGKSTILTLIELCLFGNITGIKASELKYDQAKKSQKWWVELSFLKDGNEYCVYRHETTAKAKLSVNGKELITGGQTEVTNHIVQKVLRMDQASFSNAFYARQDDFDNLIKLSPEKRKKEVSRLLRIDKIDEAIKMVRSDKNYLNTVIDEQQRHIKDEAYFKEEKKKLFSSLTEVTLLQSKCIKDVTKKEKEYEKLLSFKQTLDIQNDNYQKNILLQKEKEQELKYIEETTLQNVKVNLNEIAISKAEFSTLQDEVKHYDKLMNNYRKMQEERVLFIKKEQLTKHIAALMNKLSSKKERINKIKPTVPSFNFKSGIKKTSDEINLLENKIFAVNNEIVDLRSKLTYVANEGKRLKLERSNLQSVGVKAPCPICKRTMGEHYHSLSADYNKNLERLANDHHKISSLISDKENNKARTLKKINDLKQEKKYLEQQEHHKNLLVKELEMLQQDYLSDINDCEDVQNQLDKLGELNFEQKKFETLSVNLDKLHKKKERFSVLASKIANEPRYIKVKEEAEQKINSLKSELIKLSEDLVNMGFNIDEYRSIQNKINQSVESLRASEKELASINEHKNNLSVKIGHLEKEEEENNSEVEQLNHRKNELALLIKTEEVFKNYKVDRMSKVRPRLESIVQELISFITDGKYDLVQLDDNYNVFVFRNGIKKPFHLFSGGEQKLIALCMRLSISRILTFQGEHKNFDYLALDEVLSSMDEGRQETIINALRKLTSVFKQILMITHNSNLKDLFDNTLQVEQNIDLSSRSFWTKTN